VSSLRTRSAVEDPAYRRVNGGGKWRMGVTLNSVHPPEVLPHSIGKRFFTSVTGTARAIH